MADRRVSAAIYPGGEPTTADGGEREGARGTQGRRAYRTGLGLRAHDGDPLDLNEKLGVGEAAHDHERARGRWLGDVARADLADLRAVLELRRKHRDLRESGELGVRRGQRALEALQHGKRLRLDVAPPDAVPRRVTTPGGAEAR